MISYLHNINPQGKLKIAAYLCFIVGVYILLLMLITGVSYPEFRNDYLIPTLFISALSFLIGGGLLKKHKWAHYLAISGSILGGGLSAIGMPISLLVIFLSSSGDAKWNAVGLIFLFVVTSLPGYILLRPDVKKLLSTHGSE